MSIIFIKYQLVCSVTIEGEHIGYVKNKRLLEYEIQNIINKEGTENIAFVDMGGVPKYNLSFISNKEKVNDEETFEKIRQRTTITYHFYAVTLDGNQKAVVCSLEEAENLVSQMKQKYEKSVSVKIGIHEIYTENKTEYKTVNYEVAKKKVSKELQQIKKASVNGIYLAQKPISGIITSRFGSRESIRSHAHTGLDIAAPYGTKIKSATVGTVTCAKYQGSYGNLIVVDCGKGVEIYYGHCSKINVKEGQKVKAGDIIGNVGSTGNSTGNHLHFEIRVNGNRVNPQNYIYN